MLNPINLVKATPGMSIVLGKMFALFCEEVTESELAQIPQLGKEISDTNTTKFQVVVRGDVAKPLTLVKSFKWLALQSEIQNANSYIKTLPTDTIPADITNLNKEEIKTQVKEEAKKQIKEVTSTLIDEETKETVKKTAETAKKLKGLFSDKESLKNTLKQKALESLTTPTQTQE